MKHVIRQIKERNKLDLQSQGIKYQMWRLEDFEYRKLRQHALPIQDDYQFYMNLYFSHRDGRDGEDSLNLAEFFVTLQSLFGESSDLFDDWKGSFCFPVLLLLEKEVGNFFYLMNISDQRGSVYFSLYRILENGVDGYDNKVLREPFELEFSRQEINHFLNHLYSYLTGYSKTSRLISTPQSFVKKVDSNLIIYGYLYNNFFEEEYNTQEQFQTAMKSYLDAVDNEFHQSSVNDILQNIMNESDDVG